MMCMEFGMRNRCAAVVLSGDTAVLFNVAAGHVVAIGRDLQFAKNAGEMRTLTRLRAADYAKCVASEAFIRTAGSERLRQADRKFALCIELSHREWRLPNKPARR